MTFTFQPNKLQLLGTFCVYVGPFIKKLLFWSIVCSGFRNFEEFVKQCPIFGGGVSGAFGDSIDGV